MTPIEINLQELIIAVASIGLFLFALRFFSKRTQEFTPFSKANVVNLSSPLIVRSRPDVTGKHVHVLNSNVIVHARKAIESGWSEISLDGSCVLGYVPTKYLIFTKHKK